jgi:hypothetical protein
MARWESRNISLSELLGKEADALSDVGNGGWELVAITSNNNAYLKRLIPTASATSARSPPEEDGGRSITLRSPMAGGIGGLPHLADHDVSGR